MTDTTASVSARGASEKRRMIEEIRQELETMTEAQRVEYLLQLREVFGREQRGRLFARGNGAV